MDKSFFSFLNGYERYILPVLAIIILLWCCVSLIIKKPLPGEKSKLVHPTNGTALHLIYGENSIGRSTVCDIQINNSAVSRFHAVISKRRGGWVIIDTRSKAGIFVNGEKINKKSTIKTGDIISFGPVSFIFKEQ